MNWFSRLFSSRAYTIRRNSQPQVNRRRCLLALETLEDRTVPSTVSSITANLNGTAIPAGDTLWFNSAFTASGLPKNAAVTLHVVDAAIDFNVGATHYHVQVPNSEIVLTPGATSSSAVF